MKKTKLFTPIILGTIGLSTLLPLCSCSSSNNKHISLSVDGSSKTIEANGTASYVFTLDKDTYTKSDIAISLSGEHIQDLSYDSFISNNLFVLQIKCPEPYDTEAVYKFSVKFTTSQWSEEIGGLKLNVNGTQQSELVDNINAVIKDLEIPTMSDLLVVLIANGYDLESMSTTKPTYQWVWDSEQNVVFVMNEKGKAAIAPKGYKLNANKSKIWKMVKAPTSSVLLRSNTNDEVETQIDAFDSTTLFSQYLRRGEQFPKKLEFCSGLDVGTNSELELVFKKNEELTTPVAINTNNYASLTIESSPEDIDHYGYLSTLTIKNMPSDGVYTEHGTVQARVVIGSGSIALAEKASVSDIEITSNNVKAITVDDNATVGAVWKDIGVTIEVENVVVASEEKKEEIVVDDPIDPSTLKFAGGIGTKESPYAISTAQQLLNCQEIVNDTTETGEPNASFILVSDIDMADVTTFTGIGTETQPFTGTFDGQEFTISNLKIDKTQQFIGLFGVTKGTVNSSYTKDTDIWDETTNDFKYSAISEDKYTNVIKNINLKNITINSNGKKHAGGLIGDAIYTGIYNCSVESGSITGYKAVGGICGALEGSIAVYCTTGQDLKIKSTGYHVGGICGTGQYTHTTASGEAFAWCENHADILCESNESGGWIGGIGGMLQNNNLTAIYSCSNYGAIEVKGTKNMGVGGISGMANYTYRIANCANEGSITTDQNQQYLAGITGYGSPTLYKCTNKGNINASADVMGGIFAWQENQKGDHATLIECSNTGTIKNNNANGMTGDLAGGVPTVVLQDITFANVHDLNATISSNKNSTISVTLKNITVLDTTDEPLYFKDKMASITSNTKVCDEIKVAQTTSASTLSINVPNCNINVNDDCSHCYLVQNGKNSTITIGTNGKINNVIVTGENSKIINNGTVVNAIGIDGEASYGENNGTCSKLSLGSNAALGTTDKHFVNNGTIHYEGDAYTHVVDTCGGSVCNIVLDNYGTIKRTKTGSTEAYLFCVYSTGTRTINCYNGSKIITNSDDSLAFASTQIYPYTLNYQQGATYKSSSDDAEKSWGEKSFYGVTINLMQ